MIFFDDSWLSHLTRILLEGRQVRPRGKLTLELPSATLIVDMRRPVLTVAARKLNYRFMAAEARWMLTGDDTVAGVAPWNPNIAAFSDDGKTFFGAYGPRIHAQLDYVVNKLLEDQDTRQAGLTTWRPNPPKTKDTPCTIAMFFNVRNEVEANYEVPRLNAHVFMRSNDVWLGTPYDVFNFSMVAHLVCCRLNRQLAAIEVGPIEPGELYLTAASSHLYEEHFAAARLLTTDVKGFAGYNQDTTPEPMYLDEAYLIDRLTKLRDTKPGNELRWWEDSE